MCVPSLSQPHIVAVYLSLVTVKFQKKLVHYLHLFPVLQKLTHMSPVHSYSKIKKICWKMGRISICKSTWIGRQKRKICTEAWFQLLSVKLILQPCNEVSLENFLSILVIAVWAVSRDLVTTSTSTLGISTMILSSSADVGIFLFNIISIPILGICSIITFKYTSNVGMARKGEKQGWAPKNDPLLGNRNFCRGGLNGKVLAPGILVICPIDKNRDDHTKNWLFGPNIGIFG